MENNIANIETETVKSERKSGSGIFLQRGFDAVRNHFFVKELVSTENIFGKTADEEIKTVFPDFESYYNFLDGDIYENACYYQYSFTKKEIKQYKIDLSRINTSGFIDYTIASVTAALTSTAPKTAESVAEKQAVRKKWIAKFNKCRTYKQFRGVVRKFYASGASMFDLDFYIFNFIFADREKAFDIIMQYLSDGGPDQIARAMCIIYEPQRVLEAYNYDCRTKQTNQKHKRKLRKFIEQLENLRETKDSFFDGSTHFYCYRIRIYNEQEYSFASSAECRRYFETFEELADFLNNDLSDCNLSKAILPDVDFSIYRTNERTILPIQSLQSLTCETRKQYDKKSDCFSVRQSWKNENGQAAKCSDLYSFEYFFDFVHFLENDLSGADLLFCDGLLNLHDFSDLNLTGAKLHSKVLDRLNIPYNLSPINTFAAESFALTVRNEKETVTALEYRREADNNTEDSINSTKIYYITDLHFIHRLAGKCRTNEDIVYELQKIIDNLIKDVRYGKNNLLLIGGDTSSDFQIFTQFIAQLRQSTVIPVIFLLGNHELWEFAGNTFDEIVQKYEAVLAAQKKMYLLQNNILYADDKNIIRRISTDELMTLEKADIRDRLKKARVILFGGLAFSGQNKEFNAENGIYRNTITRSQEIEESDRFNKLYEIVCNALPDRNVIVFTHTPREDWRPVDGPQPGFVYVSGHTHRNYFYDDGDYRIYADNQAGYRPAIPGIKYFYLDTEYDIFSDYDDGIHTVTREQYIDFYRGKNIQMSFSREINILYMLKKNGYYCFIHKSTKGNLTMLNGGAMKSLDRADIKYYYDNMDTEINRIKQPLDKFTAFQKQIANMVRKIGGSGEIHGAIVDIDFWNHIYVNPYDGSITGYFATDIVYKEVYPSIPKLLETNCPALYANYVKMIEGGTKSELALAVGADSGEPVRVYLDTDIYKASREVKKMQKLYSNILSAWYEGGVTWG